MQFKIIDVVREKRPNGDMIITAMAMTEESPSFTVKVPMSTSNDIIVKTLFNQYAKYIKSIKKYRQNNITIGDIIG